MNKTIIFFQNSLFILIVVLDIADIGSAYFNAFDFD